MVYMKEIGVRRKLQIIINVVCILALGVSVVILFIYDSYAVYKEGFFCDDEQLNYPYKDNTITDVQLVVGCVAFSFLAITMCEFIAFFHLWRRRRVHGENAGVIEDIKDIMNNGVKEGDQERNDNGNNDEQNDESKEDKVEKKHAYPEPSKVLASRIGMQIVLLLYGFLLVVFVTEVIKVNTGRLRPHFFAVCQLVPGSYNCSKGFVKDYKCSQTDDSKMTDARKSFISGHASISFFHMIFIIFYIQPRLPIRYWSLLKPLIQTLAFLLAAYVSITRVTDYKHHSSDVVFGVALGTFAGYITAVKISHVVPFRRMPFPQYKFLRYPSWNISTLDVSNRNGRPPKDFQQRTV